MSDLKFVAPLCIALLGLLTVSHVLQRPRNDPRSYNIPSGSDFNFAFASTQPICAGLAQACDAFRHVQSRNNNKNAVQFLFSLLLLGGDIQSNPGPVKYPCGICERPVKYNQRGIQCDFCNKWHHSTA